MVFHWSLSDSKSPQVSRTLNNILAVLSNAVIWIVSTRPPTFKSSSSFINPLVIVPKARITSGTIVTFTFHSFFNSLARSRYLSFFSHSFSFILWSAGTAKSTILQILFFIVNYHKVGSSVESTEKDIETRLTKAWIAINRLSIIWKSDLTDKMKRSFFQAAVTSILLYGCTTWTQTKRLGKKLDGNYTRMLLDEPDMQDTAGEAGTNS